MRPHRDRRIEWWFARVTLCFGLFLMAPAQSMDSLAFVQLRLWAPEFYWGLLFAVTGVTHCGALWINGRRWWTPLVRFCIAGVNFSVYLIFAAGFYSVDPWTTGVFFYGLAMSYASIVVFYGAVKDSYHALGARHAQY
ncbi:hypothetical protein SAMN06273572_10260 [Monaibacterium marinum]|uniref:Uncharacterized protein n=1 Tax=Pontivivens marinum TaxID=1690039 RepID=A0A2C9CPX2_9RHOB|nr:hypothetical protein [Monaibacterium marinum]SOH93384.1 hypothetical protein SAMN06273572_10260 [Monaibacterium marinum]